jgi:hypothetical protein
VAASSAAVARANAKARAQAQAKAKARAAAKRAAALKRAARAKAQRAARKARAELRAATRNAATPPAPATNKNDNSGRWLELLIPFALVALGAGAVALWSRRRRKPREGAPVSPVAAAAVAPVAAPVPFVPEWEPEPYDESLTEEMPPPPVALDEPEVCTIRAWRGYVKWQFVATVRRGGVEHPAGESKAFRASGNGIPEETPSARAAYDALVAKLARDGWTTSDATRESWYSQRFVRIGSNAPPPAGEDVFDVGPLLAGHEDEEPVALPDDGAAARGNGVAVTMDDGDQRVPG